MAAPLSLDQLRVLDAIDRLGSFARAGRELHRATSAISYSVRGLEDALGLAVFDRGGHRALLTREGRVILAEGRRLLEAAGRVERLAEQLREQWEPELGIVVDGILAMSPLMRAVRRFSAAGLPTRVQLRVEYLSGVRERFERNRADLMFVLDFAGDVGHLARPLPPVEMLLLCRHDHPLRSSEPVSRASMSEHVELVVEDSGPTGGTGPSRLSLGSPHVFRFSDFHSKRQALLEGVGFGWMPRHLVQRDLSTGELVPLGFEEGDLYVFTPHLIHRRDPALGRAAELFLDLLDEEMR